MIYQEAPRKSLFGCKLSEDKGFYLEGENFEDCINQLQVWAKAHPEKWIYFHDCGFGSSYPVPVGKQLFEVLIFEWEPAAPVLFSTLFQKGREGKREVDFMSAEEKAELNRKHLMFLYMLGSQVGR